MKVLLIVISFLWGAGPVCAGDWSCRQLVKRLVSSPKAQVEKRTSTSPMEQPSLKETVASTWEDFVTEVQVDWRRRSPIEVDPETGRRHFRPGKVLAESYKVAVAPFVLGADLVASPLSVRWVRQRPASSRWMRLMLTPADILQRQGPRVVAYVILNFLGLNFPAVLQQNHSSIADLVQEWEDHPLDMNDDEITVFVGSSADRRVTQSGFASIMRHTRSKMVKFETDALEEMLETLGRLRSRGRIRELVIAGHGRRGTVQLDATGELNLLSFLKDGMGRLTARRLRSPEIQAIIQDWPEDLFAPDFRISLISCRAARGCWGSSLLEALAEMTGQEEGRVVGSNKVMWTGSPEAADRMIRYFMGVDGVERAWKDPTKAAKTLFVDAVETIVTNCFGFSYLYDKVLGTENLKVLEVRPHTCADH